MDNNEKIAITYDGNSHIDNMMLNLIKNHRNEFKKYIKPVKPSKEDNDDMINFLRNLYKA